MLSVIPFLAKVDRIILNPLIAFGFSVALLVFLWGIIVFLKDSAAGKEGEDVAKGKRHMVWGLVGLLVMFGVYGIINIVLGTFGITPTGFPFH